MQEIVSISNNKIKEYTKLQQKKYRESSNLFIVEGKKALEEILAEHIEIIDVFSTINIKHKYSLPANKITLVSEPVLKKLASTDSTPEVVVVAKKKKYILSEFKEMQSIIILENIKDAGNLGTIIRSAAAFGIEGILLIGDTVDIYNPKVVRAATGNFFKIPIQKIPDNINLKTIFSDRIIYVTKLGASNNIKPEKINTNIKSLIVFGSEADGVTNQTAKMADFNVLIPMSKGIESLNLSTSASIIFYEMFKKKML